MVIQNIQQQNLIGLNAQETKLPVLITYLCSVMERMANFFQKNEIKIIDKEWKRGKAISYNDKHELPEHVHPNDATISLYEERKKRFIKRRRREGRLYTIAPKGNAVKFTYQKNLPSLKLEKQLSEGFLLSYLFYDNGVIKYNGTVQDSDLMAVKEKPILLDHSHNLRVQFNKCY